VTVCWDHRPMAMIGYERVSRLVQHPEAQTARLRHHGCTPIFTDHGAAGPRASRPEWDRCLDRLREGDKLVTVRLDRIGRSLANLIEIVQQLAERGVDLVVLDQAIDTTTSSGRPTFHIIGAIAEFERDLINERTRERVAAAPARPGGSLPARGTSITPGKLALAQDLYLRGMTARQAAAAIGISRATLYRALSAGGRRQM
jgi:DNA invertase Pin-like site-specific DNA recombinase